MSRPGHPEELATSPALGCLEIGLFMRDGFNRFEFNRRALWQSFIILAISFVFTIASAPYFIEAKADQINVHPNSAIILLGAQFILGTALSFAFLYAFCKVLDRKQNFIKLIIVSNWTTLIPLILYLPVFALLYIGTRSYDDVYPVLIALSVYSYGLTAYIVRYVVNLPWELALFVTICLLAINEFLFDLYYILVR